MDGGFINSNASTPHHMSGDEEPDTSSSSSSNKEDNTMENVLSSFRRQWHDEIASDTAKKSGALANNTENATESGDIEIRAKRLFLMGVENEQKGFVSEAIHFYRKAVQLVPDIELKLYNNANKERFEDQDRRLAVDNGPRDATNATVTEGSTDDDDVRLRLQSWLLTAPVLCTPAVEQRSTHISSLPIEILLLIFRWIVSSDLDVRSLEMCSMVSRGFYCCARDDEIWRLICARIWGVHSGRLKSGALTWRDVYMRNPHLHFSGCYISKTTYVRHGENSFQDQFYRPWHVVGYYRYLRFFPEGLVLMMTTADGPGPMVAHLKSRNSKYPAVIVGHYRLNEDTITLVLTRIDRESKIQKTRGRNNRSNVDYLEQTYNIELKLKVWKMQSQLCWHRYRVYRRQGTTESHTNFEVLNNKFPPFWFSRVKSYTGESENILL